MSLSKKHKTSSSTMQRQSKDITSPDKFNKKYLNLEAMIQYLSKKGVMLL